MPALSAAGAVRSSASLRSALPSLGPLIGLVDSKTGEKHDRDRVSGEPLADAAGRIGALGRADGQAVVKPTSPPLAPADNVGLGAAGLLVGKRVPRNGVLAAVECI
jgi:hypothetical protein